MTLTTLSDGYMIRNVLELPEILRMVLECLTDKGEDLFAALQVNKTWYMEVVRILWKDPPPHALAAIRDDHRRQFYARFVHMLDFDDEKKSEGVLSLKSFHSAFRNIEFPRLKNITDSCEDCVDRETLYKRSTIIYRQYIQPSLEIFDVSAVEVITEGLRDTLDLLSTRCPRLEEFGICVSPSEEMTSIQWMDFFLTAAAL